MSKIEYLQFFSDEGSLKVEVRFASSKARVANRFATPEAIAVLVSQLLSDQQPSMTFDEHPGVITQINIEPGSKRVVLIARLQESMQSSCDAD